jgi:predicted  nucleic acid-binding Zn-ribbon protein
MTIDEKLERIDHRLDKIDQHLAVYNAQLKEHIRRTEIIETELKPVKSHVISVQSFFKWFAGGIGVAVALLELLRLIKG